MMILKPGDRVRLVTNRGDYTECEEGDEGFVSSEPHWNRPETHVAIQMDTMDKDELCGAKKEGDPRWIVIGNTAKLEKIRDEVLRCKST